MKDIYRFSPIESVEEIETVFEYIVNELEKLSLMLFDQKLPITTLKIFAHYPKEYEFLYDAISRKGPPAEFNSTTSYYAKVKENINGYDIDYLGARVVDPYRPHVGCGDFELEDFAKFKEKNLHVDQYVREVKKDMLEIWHPDFDVLGYVIPLGWGE